MQIRRIMTSNVSTLEPNSTIGDAARIMRDLNVGSVPVCQGRKPVGIVTDRDITIRSIANGGDSNTPVNQVMSSKLVSGSPDMSDREAARIMAEHQIRRLPIVENGELVGMLSLGDLAVRSETDMEAGEALSEISIPSRPQR
jgi:CBS domain-containing protein